MMTFARDWWAADRRPPRWAVLTVAVILTFVGLLGRGLPGWAIGAVLLSTGTALALVGAYPLVSLGIGAALSLAAAVAMATAVPLWSVALAAAVVVLSGLAGRRMTTAGPALVVFAAAALLTFPVTAEGERSWGTGLLMLITCVAAPWSAGRYGRQQAELVESAAQRARLRERTRIAQDMHDSLGHELSLLALRAGALELAADLPDRHRTAAGELRAGAGDATGRLADIIGVLRDGDPAGLDPARGGIPDLVERAADVGMAVSLSWHGGQDQPSMVERAAHRVVQEALTNASKHAPGAVVTVRVVVEPARTRVTVTNGPPRDAPRRVAGTGIGLIGLSERTRLCGGTFRAGPRDGGFEVAADLPHQVSS